MQSLNTLEYQKLLAIVSRNAQTKMGKARFAELRPHTSRLELEKDLRLVAETLKLNEEKQVSWSFSELPDPTDAVAILRIRNATLEPITLLELTRLCNQALFARSVIAPEKEFAPNLWRVVENLPPTLFAAIDRINKKLLPTGEIDDTASPELARLRREINSQRSRLQKSLEAIMRGSSEAIQDAIVTQRNERFVIPVKADFRGKITGVAHGFSSSGATIFIEPLDAIEANNELAALKEKEEREVSRILFELTETLRAELPAVESAVGIVEELDFIKAKVEFARKFRAVVPVINDEETLRLIDARHPVLEENLRQWTVDSGQWTVEESKQRAVSSEQWGENSGQWAGDSGQREENKSSMTGNKGLRTADSGLATNPKSQIPNPKSDVVPASFTLDRDKPVMIISGANAGGKTVVMKTAGLLSLMAISGLPVPAREASIPFYKSVLADIGDNQSLSANLSTFSSHISNIAGMMKTCEHPALVLLDEVGTGTDPEEGSALGVAIVDYFRRKCRAQVIASTHYRGLKIYATNDENVINASVEFDEKTLQPTYRLLTGLAGASSGIEIARRFGIPNDVIAEAKDKLDISAREVSDYLLKIRRESQMAEDLRIALEEEREATAKRFALLDIEAGKRERERQKEFQKELADTIQTFERQAKAFVAGIEDKALKTRLEKEMQARKSELNRKAMSVVGGQGAGISGQGSVAGGRKEESEPKQPVTDNRPITVGVKVLTSFGNVGTVEKIDNEMAEVLVGSMRLREKVKNLKALAENAPEIAKPTQGKLEKLQNQAKETNLRFESEETKAEINLIGKKTIEIDDDIDRFLDEAYLNGRQIVRIVHGMGTGALRAAVHDFLRHHPHVSRYTLAAQNEGGAGATIVELKQ